MWKIGNKNRWINEVNNCCNFTEFSLTLKAKLNKMKYFRGRKCFTGGFSSLPTQNNKLRECSILAHKCVLFLFCEGTSHFVPGMDVVMSSAYVFLGTIFAAVFINLFSLNL